MTSERDQQAYNYAARTISPEFAAALAPNHPYEPASVEALAGMDDLIQHRSYELETTPVTTRTERLTAYLQSAPGPDGEPIPDMVRSILAIADDRTLLSLGDVSKRIGRAPTTIKSWLLDRQLTGRKATRPAPPFPRPVYDTGAGLLWDGDEVAAWMVEYPEQVHLA